MGSFFMIESKDQFAGIAQLVEHLPEEQRVPSSSLGPSTQKLKHL